MRRLPSILGPTAATFAVAVALFLIAPYALLVMAPALALAWLVAVGAFTGERAISWVRRALRRTVRPARSIATASSTPRLVSRGGLLLAASLASRPPPAVALTAAP